LIKCFLISARVTVQELERLLAFDRPFASAEMNALGRVRGAVATVGRHERRTEQRETADGYRERGTESGHGVEHGTLIETTW
jgi:hypothetical protein